MKKILYAVMIAALFMLQIAPGLHAAYNTVPLTVGYEGGYVKLTTQASYNTATGDQVICVNKTTGSATAIQLNLPATVFNGQDRVWRIKDCKGDAATNNITVTPSSGTIDGQTSYTLTNNYQANEFRYDGTSVSVW